MADVYGLSEADVNRLRELVRRDESDPQRIVRLLRKRWPVEAEGDDPELVDVTVTQQPAKGRGKYTGNRVSYVAGENGLELAPADSDQLELEFYVKSERKDGSPFFVVGDEITIRKVGKIWVSVESDPRGFL